MPAGEVSKRIKNVLTGLVKGTGDVVGSTMEITREAAEHAMIGIKRRKDEARRVSEEAVANAIQAGKKSRAPLDSVAKGAIMGVIQGLRGTTKITTATISNAVRTAIRSTAEAGGDVPSVARKSVEGAIEAGRQAGLKVEDVASAAATAAIAEAGEISVATANAVTRAVSGTISGVQIVLKVPFKPRLILAVDSNRGTLDQLMQSLDKEGYKTKGAASLADMDEAIQGNDKFVLALIDMSGFDQSIWVRCDRLRNARIPFVVISPQRSPAIQRDSIKYGASGLLVKPVGIKDLREYIDTLAGD